MTQLSAPTLMLRSISAGNLNQFLPDFQTLTLSPIFSDAGSVTFTYPESGKNFALLVDDAEIGITLDGVEVGSLRCIIEQVEGNDVDEAETGAIWTFTCRTTLALLERARVYPKLWPVMVPPTFDFNNATPGKILIDLVTASQGRGALVGVTWDFTATHDSAGNTWVPSVDISYDAGVTLLDVVSNLRDAQQVEVRMDKHKLQAYNPQTLGTDKSTGSNPLRFQGGRDVKESPRRAQTRGLATTVLVAGDNGVYVSRSSDIDTMAKYGVREGYLSQSGVDVVGTLNVVGDAYLQTVNREIMEVTHSLYFDTAVNPRPITNFELGDWGLSDVGNGWEKYRIKQWVLAVDNAGEVSGSVTLNDLIGERIDRLNLAIKDLYNGMTAVGASEEADDHKNPAQTSTIETSSAFYLQNGQPRSTIDVEWNEVTTNADGSAATDIDNYHIRWRYDGDTTWKPSAIVEADTFQAHFDNVIPGLLANVQVLTVDKWGHNSGWKSGPNVTSAGDTTAPPKTSPPIVVSNVGTLRVVWDGKDSAGNAMPADFLGVEVHVGPNGTFTPTSSTLRDFLGVGPTATTLTSGLVYGTEYWVRLVSVDTWNNKGTPSDETSTSHAILTQVVATEIGTGEVGLNNVRFSDVGNIIDDGSFEIASARVDRQAQLTGTHLTFDSTVSSNGGWSLKSSAFASPSAESLKLQGPLPVKPGERIFAAFDGRATSDAVGVVNLAVKWFNSAGAQIDNTGSPSSTSYVFVGLTQITLDNLWHARLTNASQLAPVNASSMEFWLLTSGRSTGSVWVDAVEIRRQIDTLLVADAAITTAKIANLAVNDAQIGSMSAGKITVGTLSADITLSARIKTANTGARAEMNSGGFGLWDSAGNQTLYTNSSTGEIRVTGSVVTTQSGRRIELNPTSLPEIRFYPNTGTNYAFINAVSGGTNVNLGLNSGQFASGSDTLTYRIYMTDAGGGATFETIDAATQVRNGGYWGIGPTHAVAGVTYGGDTMGFLEMYADDDSGANDVAASVGNQGNTNATDTWLTFYNTGQLEWYGWWDSSFAPGINFSVLHATGTASSAISGWAEAYGVTGIKTWYPVVQVRDQTAHAGGMDSLNASGFSVGYDLTTTGTSGLNYWGYADG